MKILVLTLLSLCASVSFAQSSPAPASKSAASPQLAAARELQKMLLPKTQWSKMVDGMLQQMAAGMAASGRNELQDPKRQKTMRLVIEEALPYDEMIEWSAEVYARRFTAAELNDVIKFYKTPSGAKLMAALPEIMGEAGLKMGQLLPQRLPGLMKKHGLQ